MLPNSPRSERILAASAAITTVLLTSSSYTAADGITVRAREPIILKAQFFGSWLGNTATDDVELWTHRNGAWDPVPYQVDDLQDLADMDNNDLFDPLTDPSRRSCSITPSGPPPNAEGPCEPQYTLTGEGPPTGTLTGNDELVFIAGFAGDCDATLDSWPPNPTFDDTRYRIQIDDDTETGCVYLLKRVSGTRPHNLDLVDYDPVGDGAPGPNPPPGTPTPPDPVPEACLPNADACGAILGTAHDADGDGNDDWPDYRLDFYGNWSIDKWYVGENCASQSCPTTQDNLDLWKWRFPTAGAGRTSTRGISTPTSVDVPCSSAISTDPSGSCARFRDHRAVR